MMATAKQWAPWVVALVMMIVAARQCSLRDAAERKTDAAERKANEKCTRMLSYCNGKAAKLGFDFDQCLAREARLRREASDCSDELDESQKKAAECLRREAP
jgi:hypothetical protein